MKFKLWIDIEGLDGIKVADVAFQTSVALINQLPNDFEITRIEVEREEA